MALVPNGKVRTMVAQALPQSGVWNPAVPPQELALAGDGQQAKPDARNNIEQQDIQPGNGAAQSPDSSALQQKQEMPQEQGMQGGETPQNANNPAEVGQSPQQPDHQLTDQQRAANRDKVFQLEQTYFELMGQTGIPVRSIEKDRSKRGRMFGLSGGDGGDARGHFVIPMNTPKGRRNGPECLEIGAKLCKQFGFGYDWKKDGNNIVINFKPHDASLDSGLTNSSLDELWSTGDKGGGAVNKSAMTIGEMLEFRRSDLYDTMRKIANGVK